MKRIVLIFFLFASITTNAQFSPAQQYVKNLDSFYRYTPLEKAFLHTDKEWYFPGETIWFKAYVTADDELNELSKVIYVDVTNSLGAVVLKSKWKLNNMSCKGDLYLNKEMPPGTYSIRAYTLYMLNTRELIDEKLITVLSDSVQNTKPVNSILQPHIYFFPEGGNTVQDLNSKIAYKITLPNHLPLQNTSLTVTDEAGTKIFNGEPLYDGMGSFYLTPEKGKTYKAAFTYNSIVYTSYLPAPLNAGVVMELNNTSQNKLFVSVTASENAPSKNVIVIAQMNGTAVYAQKYNLTEGSAAGAIDKKNLPNGTLSVTVFSETMQPLCERIVYIKKFSYQPPELTPLQKPAEARSKISLKIDKVPDSSLLSIAVTDAEEPAVNFTNHNIVTYFLLGAEVKGYVHNPWFYFKLNDSLSNAALDLVMLTNGWRRFKTTDIVNGTMPLIKYYPETGIAVKGSIKDEFKKSIPEEGKINAIIKTEDSTTIYTDAVITKNGRFSISGLDFKKRGKLYLRGNHDKKTQTLPLQTEPGYIDTLTSFENRIIENEGSATEHFTKTTLQLAARFEYKRRNPGELQEIIVTGKAKTKEQLLTEQYSTEQFKQSEFTYVIDSNIAYASIWQYLVGAVPGLNIGGNMIVDPVVNFNRFSNLRDNSIADVTFVEQLNNNMSSIAFYLNEVLVPMVSITDLNPKDIALIKVNRNPNMGLNAPLGSMFIYTRKGYNSRNAGFNPVEITGYSTAKEFFNPVYDTKSEQYFSTDMRSTLYWNADWTMKKEHSIIEFYNNDVSKKLKVTICGLDKNGNPLFLEKIID
jgi:hypothetical protein